MKIIALFFILTSFFSAYSINHNEIYSEQTDEGFVLFIDNDNYCPISIEVKMKLSNLKSTKGNNKVFVIPARSEKHQITVLKVVNKRKSYGFETEVSLQLGDVNTKNYDKNYIYYLPYKKGDSFFVWQGYNGYVSHKNENSLDFSFPYGTEVYSARGGFVVEIVENNFERCDRIECMKYNNYILVYHQDGSFAAYAHIKKNGAEVMVGQKIEKGQFIGYSGDVGYTTGPHLHFMVFLPRLKEQESVRTKFLIGEGERSVYLVEDEEYIRDY